MAGARRRRRPGKGTETTWAPEGRAAAAAAVAQLSARARGWVKPGERKFGWAWNGPDSALF